MVTFKSHAARTAAATFFACAAGPVFAQSADQADTADDRAIEVLVVTTQKREQSVEDVPINITAYSGALLDRIGVTEFDELSDFTPGFIVQEQSPNNPGFVIRGVTSDDGSASGSPRVTVYENGFDVSRSRGSQFELFDLERAEVVKGPQATLFGTASLVGAVSIITAKPEPGITASAEASYGNFDFVKARGHVNYGTDLYGIRLAVSYRRRDGFVENIAGDPGSQTPDGPQIEDLNGLEIFAIRPSLRFTPTDDLTVDFVFNFQQEDPPGTAFKSGIFPPTGGTTDPNSFAELAGIPNSIDVFGAELGLDRQRFSANLTVNYDLNDYWSFASVTGYLNFDSVEVFDADGFAAPFLEFVEDATGEIISQEFRATYASDRFTGFFGVNWYHEEGTQSVPFATDEGVLSTCFGAVPIQDLLGIPAAFQAPCLAPDGSVGSAQPFLESVGLLPPGTDLTYAANFFTDTGNQDQLSFFLDGTYQVTDRLEVTGGIRFIYEDRVGGSSTDFPVSILPTTSAVLGGFIPNSFGEEVTFSEDFFAVVGRFNALYRISDALNAYVTIGRGRRSPILDVTATGVDTGGQATGVLNLIDPEILWNYEGGVKGSFFDGALTGGISIFFQDYSNFVTTLLDEATLQQVPITAGESSNLGVEFEFFWRASDTLSFFGNYAFSESEIDGDPALGLDGAPFRLQAEHQASAGALYDRIVFTDYRVFGTATVNFRSEVVFEEATTTISGLFIGEGSVTEVDLRAGFGDAEERWEISGFVTNLNNQSFIIDAGNTGGAFGIPTFIAGAPRFFGVELKYRY